MIHSTLLSKSKEVEKDSAFYLQNKKLLKVELSHGKIMALNGSMIAYQGEASFRRVKSGGLNKFFTKAITGEGTNYMEVSGRGEVFLAHGNADVQILYLENDSVIVNSANVLAFSTTLSESVDQIKSVGSFLAGGLFNTKFSGTGYLAIITVGEPFSINIDPSEDSFYADPQAVVLWTPGVSTDIKVDSGGLGTIFRGGTGESIQMSFKGNGIVVCQSSELQTFNELNSS